jgi:hypothetical protein
MKSVKRKWPNHPQLAAERAVKPDAQYLHSGLHMRLHGYGDFGLRKLKTNGRENTLHKKLERSKTSLRRAPHNEKAGK